MRRYINADLTDTEILNVVQEETADADTFITVRRVLNKLPTEDVAPVVHARWIVNRDYGDCTCSVCRTVYEDNGETISDYWNYCPHCGAKMDE